MKLLVVLFLMAFSATSFAATYQTTGTTIKYDRGSNAIIVGESQRVTESNGATHNRGIGTFVPLGKPQGISINQCAPKVYHHGKLIKGGC